MSRRKKLSYDGLLEIQVGCLGRRDRRNVKEKKLKKCLEICIQGCVLLPLVGVSSCAAESVLVGR